MPLGMEVGLGVRDVVLNMYPAPPPLKGDSPQFSANVRCGQAARWTKMPLGMAIGLGPGDFTFDEDSVYPEKRAHHPTQFWPMPIVVKRLDG